MKDQKKISTTELDYPITPIDGRYQKKTKILSPYFSEYGLVKYRLIVELRYLEKLSQYKIVPDLTKKETDFINELIDRFDGKEFAKVKEIETVINHDVKSVEYYIREKFKTTSLKKLSPYIHIGLTSEDTSNLAYGLMFKDVNANVIRKEFKTIITMLSDFAKKYKAEPILARTHGQPAIPTTFGKEMANYTYRLQKQYKKLVGFSFEGKLNGAVGASNGLQFVYPTVDWLKLSQELIKKLGLTTNLFTTQILPGDNLVEYFQILAVVNGIMINLCQDIWTYIMLEEIKLRKKEGEVGSSTMPQKVNPIDFENAEGNLQVANSYCYFYQQKLLVSRLQRDLTDSTVKRTFGTALGHMIIAWSSLARGLGKIDLNVVKTKENLNRHFEILTEVIQIYLRSIKDDQGYEKVKALMRGKNINQKEYQLLCQTLKIKDKKFLELTPHQYTGLAEKLVGLLKS